MSTTTTFAQRTGAQPARARVAVPAVVAQRAVARPISASPTMPSMYGHVWQATGIVRFDATNGALGTSTKCPSRPLGPRTT
jgi:hypothetical protein